MIFCQRATELEQIGSNDLLCKSLRNDRVPKRRLVWQFSTGDLVLGTPTVDEASGTCFVGSVDRRMYALDLAR